jgi:hypothetical protein
MLSKNKIISTEEKFKVRMNALYGGELDLFNRIRKNSKYDPHSNEKSKPGSII